MKAPTDPRERALKRAREAQTSYRNALRALENALGNISIDAETDLNETTIELLIKEFTIAPGPCCEPED